MFCKTTDLTVVEPGESFVLKKEHKKSNRESALGCFFKTEILLKLDNRRLSYMDIFKIDIRIFGI